MRKIYMSIMLLLAAVSMLKGQNLDPTVVVSRAYEGKLMDVNKPVVPVSVPDSVYRFDLDFDYSVFSSPYKGSYEFNPYTTTMQPSSSRPKSDVLYLKAGAGYELHPMVDFILSPRCTSGLRWDIYATNRSYFGKYKSIAPVQTADGLSTLNGVRSSDAEFSHDVLTRAGFDLGYDWKKTAFDVDMSYFGIAMNDQVTKRAFNAFDAKFDIYSKTTGTVFFDMRADYRYGQDKVGEELLNTNEFDMEMVVGATMKNKHRLLFDIESDVTATNGPFEARAIGIAFTPHYVIIKDRWNVDIGLRIDALIPPDDSRTKNYKAKSQFAYPDVTIRYEAIQDAMAIFVNAAGGNKVNSYSSILEGNHHFTTGYDVVSGHLLDNTVERISATLGFEGRVATMFSYNVRGGYNNYANALLNAVYAVGDGSFEPGIGYASYQRLFAALDWRLATESVSFNGSVLYNYTDITAKYDKYLAPAALTADVDFEYNWNRRIFFGVDAELATAQKNAYVRLPWYVDLGASAEYAVSHRFSAWVRGGNLLNMTIHRNPLYVQNGLNFIVGITLNL